MKTRQTKQTAMTGNGRIVSIGDVVYFKADVEQPGRIVEIHRDVLIVEPVNGTFEGDYIADVDLHEVDARDTW